MNKVTSRQILFPLIIGILLLGIVTVAFLPTVTYDMTQKYSDVIFGLAGLDTNKTGELTLYKSVLVGACVLSAVLAVLIRKLVPSAKGDDITDTASFALILVSINLLYYLLIGGFNSKLIFASIFILVSMAVAHEDYMRYCLLGLCSYYTILALVSLTTLIGSIFNVILWKHLSQPVLYLLTLCLVFSVIVWQRKARGASGINNAILGMQVLIPCNLFMFLKSQYLYQGETLNIPFPMGFYLIILAVWLALTVTAVRFALHRRKDDTDVFSLIAPTLAIIIFIINSYIVPARLIPTDVWHHGEQVTAWQQFVDQGQSLYTEFAPSSGLHALPIGFIMNVLLDGTASSYAAAYSMINMLAAVIVIWLCCRLTNQKTALILALISAMPIYNRGILALMYFLVLLQKDLIESRSTWLKAWVLLTLAAGLYYPIIGGSLLIATMPFGLIQLAQFFQTGEFTRKRKTPRFWITGLLVLAITAASFKILFPMAQYMLSLAGQSLEADSYTLLRYTACPTYFMTWLPEGWRYVIYLFVRICLAGFLQVVMVTLLVSLIQKNNWRSVIKSPMFFILSAGILFNVVYNSFSLYRADTLNLLSRTSIGVVIAGQLLVIGMAQYGNSYFTRKAKSVVYGLLIPVIIVLFASGSIFTTPNVNLGTDVGTAVEDVNRISSVYAIDDGMWSVIDEESQEILPRLGNGFVKTSDLNQLKEYKTYITQNNLEDQYFLNFPRFYYYILNVKAAYTDSTTLMHNYDSQEALLKKIKPLDPIVVNITNTYELIKWMTDAGYQQLSNGWHASEKTISEFDLQSQVVSPEVTFSYPNLGRSANAFGKSLDTLEPLFDRKMEINTADAVTIVSGAEEKASDFVITHPTYSFLLVTLPEEISGAEYDYVYLKMSTDIDMEEKYSGTIDEQLMRRYSRNEKLDTSNAAILWGGENNQYENYQNTTATFGTGELLYPMGFNTKWINASHNSFQILLASVPVGTTVTIEKLILFGRE